MFESHGKLNQPFFTVGERFATDTSFLPGTSFTLAVVSGLKLLPGRQRIAVSFIGVRELPNDNSVE